MKKGQAFWAGIVGGVVMSLLLALARAMGIEANLELMLGTLLFPEAGGGAWLAGFLMHLLISGAIGLLYALGFEHFSHRAGVPVGIGLGIIHLLIGGIFLGLMPRLHPHMPEVLSEPGAFLVNGGAAGVLTFIIVHLSYGAVMGGMYGPVLHPARVLLR